ncbi:MAG: isocitrate lyase/phosphoenolpyruvate mutase family protein [Pseudomonadales bacterium]
MANQAEKAATFQALHARSGAFLIPNPWDAGSARVLEGLGFEALATTSAGFAQTLGRRDGCVDLEETVVHVRTLCDASSVPLSVDLENGFADSPEAVAAALLRVAEAGAVGASIEDFDGRDIYPMTQAVERIEAAVAAVGALPFPFMLTARAENLLHGVDDLDDTLKRLQAFAQAGADVVFAPGLRSLDQVRTVCAGVACPVNVLAPFLPSATLAELADAGARRVSVGGALALVSLAPVLDAAREMLEHGSFGWLSQVRAAAAARTYLMSKEQHR